jgi:hypothetical protein
MKKIKRLKKILDNARKGTNINYQSVVNGTRPSRAARSEQLSLQQMSRQDLYDYWMDRLETSAKQKK